MTTTYQDPSTDTKDAVRFRIGDTDTADAYLTDGEINYCLMQANGDVLGASLIAIRNIIARLSYTAGNESVGPVSEGGSEAAINALMQTYSQLESELGRTASMIVTGISVTDKLCPDWWATRPAFRRPLNPNNVPGDGGRFLGAALGNIPIDAPDYGPVCWGELDDEEI